MSEGFLTRWSRRKSGAAVPEEEVQAPAGVPEPLLSAPTPPEVVAPVETLACEQPAEPAGAPVEDATRAPPLPSLDSLAAQSDLTAFLRPGVPAPLRQAAMRRMWSLDTGIRDFIGPADYAWDYNVEGGVPGSSLRMVGNMRAMLAQVVGRTEAQLAAYDAGAPDEDTGEAIATDTALEAPAPAVVSEPALVAVSLDPRHDQSLPLLAPAFVPPAVVVAAWPGSAQTEPAPVEPIIPPAPMLRRKHGGACPV